MSGIMIVLKSHQCYIAFQQHHWLTNDGLPINLPCTTFDCCQVSSKYVHQIHRVPSFGEIGQLRSCIQAPAAHIAQACLRGGVVTHT